MIDICAVIRTERKWGRTTCEIYRGSTIIQRAERLKSLGFTDMDNHTWDQVSKFSAQMIIEACLHRDLAYRSENMTQEHAARLAEAFMAQLPDECTFLTNGNPYGVVLPEAELEIPSWNPISHSTFDTGVVAEHNGVVSIPWVEDED